jgi:prepilin signal peptidase PulO-like enzyme (type II secretory pathway)
MHFWVAIVTGILSGTLVNYLGDVLPWTRRVSKPVCNQCGEPIPWNDYFRFKPCPNAHRRLIRWGIVWGFYILLSILMVFIPPTKLEYLPGIVIFTYFGLLGLIDIEHRVVLNETVFVGLAICVIYGIFLHGIANALIGGLVGFGVMFALYGLGLVFSRWMAKKKELPADEVALGFGDVNLSGLLGLAVGWPLVILELLSAILAAGVISGIIILGMVLLRKYRPFQAIPYAPFLILAAGVLLYLLK